MTKPHHHGRHTSTTTIAAALERIRALGGRVTTTKRAIVTALFEESDGTTAEALVGRLGNVDLTTAYRALSQLEEAGVIEHTHLGHGPASYRLRGDDTINVICTNCGKLTLIPATEFDEVTTRISARYGIALNLQHFAISGHCNDDECGPTANN